MNPFAAYLKFALPTEESNDIQELSQGKSIASILLVGWLITIYSYIKWTHHDVSDIATASLIPILGTPFLIYCLKTKLLSLDVLSNLGLSFLFFFSAVVIYNLGAINSAHILWPAVIIMTAYITGGRKSGAVWSFISILFLFWLIYSDRNGYNFPHYVLNPKQTLINQYSGYILPIILLWIGQEYAARLRQDFLNGLNANLKISEALTIKSEKVSSKLSGIITEAETSAVTLLKASTELSSTVGNMNSLTSNIQTGVDKQTSASGKINHTLIEMASSVDQSNTIMSDIRNFMLQTEGSVANSAQAMEQTIQNMLRIKESNEGIRNTMGVISDIADQTNLLALNAAIEAARAGDQGRGFAVVSDEVRNLSIKSNQAAGEIKKLLETASRDVTEGSETVDRAGIILTEIVNKVRDVSISISETADTMNQQNKAIEGIVKSSTEVEYISQENEEAAQSLQDGNKALSNLSEELSSIAQTMHEIVRSQ